MKVLIGVFVSALVGVGCRFFDIPVPSPPVLPGALLVLAMTLGYSGTDRLMVRRARASTTKHLCGGPTGTTTTNPIPGVAEDCAATGAVLTRATVVVPHADRTVRQPSIADRRSRPTG